MLSLWFDFWPSNYGPWPPQTPPPPGVVDHRIGIHQPGDNYPIQSGVLNFLFLLAFYLLGKR